MKQETKAELLKLASEYNKKGRFCFDNERLICDVLNSLMEDNSEFDLFYDSITRIFPDYYLQNIAERANALALEHLKGRWKICYNHHIDGYVIYIDPAVDDYTEVMDMFWEHCKDYKCDMIVVWELTELPKKYDNEATVLYESTHT